MTYQEALKYIHQISWKGSIPGLSRIDELCKLMGNPEKNLKIIHIAGTNGKGSTASYLTSILREAGLKVGTFTSPFVKNFNERICIDGSPVSNYLLTKAIENVKSFADTMQDTPTEFELITAVGFECFVRKNCDIVVLEVGLGGRFDSTNVIDSSFVSVITGISFDHTQLLGDTLSKIAWEKAGIIKHGRPLCIGNMPSEAKSVILREANEKNAPVCEVQPEQIKTKSLSLERLIVDYKDYKNLRSSLIGMYQPYNIALVCEIVHTIETLGITIGREALYRGIENARWSARFELLSKEPPVIFDGGHNEEGVIAAINTVKHCFEGKVNILTGVMADKDYETMAGIISTVAKEVFTITPDNPRSLSAENYAKVFEKRGVRASAYDSITSAVRVAKKASKKENTPLIILGSLYMYKDIYKHFKK